jgi:hypothetical protein
VECVSIEGKIRATIAEESKREQNWDYRTLRDFYEAKKREGVALKPEYSLPPLDTVGRSLHVSSKRSDEK